MHNIRRQILEILKERTQATVAELADTLNMPAVSVRHHLDILQGEDLIRVDRLGKSGSVGRPQQIYTLTESAGQLFPNNFAALAGTLVRQMKQVLPAEQVACAFQNIAREIACEFEKPQADQSMPFRLDRVTAFLNQRGYVARWEESGDGDGYILQKCNCPYTGVSAEHHELCVMDQMLIDQLVGCHCERTQSIQAGAHSCAYRISHEVSGTAAISSEMQGNQRSSIALFA